jgi:predicted Zn-dependent protease
MDRLRQPFGGPAAFEPGMPDAPGGFGPAGPAAFGGLGGEMSFLFDDDAADNLMADREGLMDFRTVRDEFRLLVKLRSESAPIYQRGASRARGPQYQRWIDNLFPPLRGAPAATQQAKSTWPAVAQALATSLLRRDQLAHLKGGIEIARTTETFDARWGELAGRSRRVEIAGAKAWVTRSDHDGGQTLVSWCDGKEIGIYSKATLLGRVRAATPHDVQPAPLDLEDYSLTSLEQTYAGHTVTLEPQGKERTLLTLKQPSSPDYEVRLVIDTVRHVIVSSESRHKDKVTSTTTFSDFVEAAGSWWAQRIETADANGKRVSLTTQTVKSLDANTLDERFKAELTGRPQVQVVHLPLPAIVAAKKAQAAGKTTFDDQFLLLLHFHRSQQWPRVLEHLQQAEKLAADKPGMRWLRSAILHDTRRHDELRQRFQDDVRRLANESSGDAYFLAEYIVQQSSGMLEANEMLALLDVLRPLYEKQPAHVHAARRWQQLRVAQLSQTGRTDEALKLQKQLATDYPRDYALQQNYAQALAAAGDHPAAYTWLSRVLTKVGRWRDDEADALRGVYAQLLEQEGRFADLVQYLAAWVEDNHAGSSAYERYLSALIRFDKSEKSDALALRWLKDGQVPGELTPPVEARLNAAINMMQGNAYQMYTNRIEDRWLIPLADAALYFVRHESHLASAGRILSHYQFLHSEEGRTVRKALAGMLAAESDKLSPARVERFVGWVEAEDLEPAAWKKIVDTVRERWTNERDDYKKYALGQALYNLLPMHGDADARLAFIRLQREKGPERFRAEYTNRLFNYLLDMAWTAETEAELFTLIDRLSDADDAGQRLFTSVAAVHRLTDKLLEARYTARMKTVEHPEKLTRTELMKKQEESRLLAREGLADRLHKEATKHPKGLSRWLIAESMYLDVVLDRNLKQAAAAAWEIVGPTPPAKAEPGAEATIEHTLDALLRQRSIATLMNLAARKGADPALAARLLKHFDECLRAEADAAHWKLMKYRLLVALDRPKDLEQTLTAWTREEDADSRWRVALGYVLAEQGRLPEAIRQFEAVEAADELTPPNYRALSDWYLVQNRRNDHERAALAVYKTTPEHYLHQMIAVRLQPWQRRDAHLPSELDREVLRMFIVLFDKSASPQNYIYQLQQFYEACHDFRLLAVLPDAVVGHTAARVYPFLQGMTPVMHEVRDEATADELVKRIGEVRPRARTAVDQRALDLLEVMVERRAAELLNQPGPHRDRALAALVRAGKREWSPGEPRLMADFLAGLGAITQVPLAKEQLRQLQELHSTAKHGTQDRLHIALRHALTLNGYQRRNDAIDLLQAALNEFREANDGVLPVSANAALGSFIDLLEEGGHFARGEQVLQDELKQPVHAQQRRWHIQRLNELYHHTLQRGGEVSLGKGLALYQALDLKIKRDLLDTDPNHRQRLITLLCLVYRTAAEQKQADVVVDVKRFAFEMLTPLMPQLANQHATVVSTVANVVHDLVGPRDGIVFLVNQIETEPRWLRQSNQDGWNQHGWTIATWRLEAKNLGDAEPRLLRLALAELRRDLLAREDRQRPLYNRHYTGDRFWAEKADDFARVAEEVLAERSQSGIAVAHIAHYFHYGLGRANRAIEILFVAHKQKLLDENGQAKLVAFLHQENRFAESIPVLEPLVARRPPNLEYRVQLMHAYFRTAQNAKLLALLKDTDAFFHQKDRWTENVMARLAESTLGNELYEQSVAYYKELIPLHERTHPGRGIGNGTLSNYYSNLANAYAALKKTPEAVDAAGAAVVSWGMRHNQRAAALETLKQVLMRSPDLDGFVAHLDKQKQDSAIIRKALGQAYRAKGEHAKAIVQLELAAELQPNDAEIRQLLVGALDERNDKDGALRQLLRAVQATRRDLRLYEDLGKRYAAAGQPEEAERAYTSIVEMQPTESESHALLAEVREKQNRWGEAIEQWEQVARIRALEPTGLLKLAAAQIHEKQWDAAHDSLRKLTARSWPPRFNDVPQQIRMLEAQMPK